MLGFRGVWEMHQSTCTVIKVQIKLISDNSLRKHLSRATYSIKNVLSVKKKRGAGGLHEYLTCICFVLWNTDKYEGGNHSDRKRMSNFLSQSGGDGEVASFYHHLPSKTILFHRPSNLHIKPLKLFLLLLSGALGNHFDIMIRNAPLYFPELNDYTKFGLPRNINLK